MATSTPDIGGFWYSVTHPIDTIENAVTGKVTADQQQQIDAGVYSDIIKAGGSTEDASAAVDEVNGYNQTYNGGTADQTLSSWASFLKTGGPWVIGIGLLLVIVILHEVNN